MRRSFFWRALLGYLQSRVKVALFVLACLAILAVVCVLLSVPLSGVLYGCALCIALALCVAVPDFLHFARKHAELSRLGSSPLSGADELPEPNGLIERDYDALLSRMGELRMNELADKAREKRAQSDYYAMWAHQIKVPISALKLLLRNEPNSAALSSELLRIEQYVDMALGYERLQSQSTDYVIRDCALDPVIRQTVRRFAPLFIQKKLRLDCRDTGMTVLTDEKWLAFVMEQLLSNAVKYTRAGGAISIYADRERCLLTVEDTGIGIAPEDLPRVFEQGYTGFNGRADKRATGLGLYLCKQVLNKLEHSIAIESELSKGTRVVLGFQR